MGKPYRGTVKPFNFLLVAQVRPFGHPAGADPERFHLIAPWNDDARQWLPLQWIDRYTGRTYAVTTAGPAGGLGLARVKRHDEVLAEYASHREQKSTDRSGRPCAQDTSGVLLRRAVGVRDIKYVGKESNYLDEAVAGLYHDEEEVLTTYEDPKRAPWLTLIVPIMRDIPTGEVARKTRLDRSTIKRYKSRRAVPHARNRAKLIRAAAAFARRTLGRAASGLDDFAACRAYFDASSACSVGL